ncbi:MAG: hypothetical protein Q8R70_03530 [Methanoregula sp.]|nr:hypothetical protein [Methanoregula sp.]
MSKAKIERTQKLFLKAMKEKFAPSTPETVSIPWEPKNPCTEYGTLGFKRLQELHNEAGRIRGTICHNTCIFSHTCGKKGQDVIDCKIVVEERRTRECPR